MRAKCPGSGVLPSVLFWLHHYQPESVPLYMAANNNLKHLQELVKWTETIQPWSNNGPCPIYSMEG